MHLLAQLMKQTNNQPQSGGEKRTKDFDNRWPQLYSRIKCTSAVEQSNIEEDVGKPGNNKLLSTLASTVLHQTPHCEHVFIEMLLARCMHYL